MQITWAALSKAQEVSLRLPLSQLRLMLTGTDNIIQTIVAGAAVFGGAGSYPLEGGLI